MKMTKRILSFCFLVGLLIVVSACSRNTRVPAAAEAVVEQYYDEKLKSTAEIDPAVIESCMYWKSEEERMLTLENLYQIIDYKIDNRQRLGDDLCVFSVLVQDEGMPESELEKGSYQQFYMFSVRIDGCWYICGQRNIPDTIAAEYDLSAYGNDTVIGYIGEIEVIEPQYVIPPK